MTEDELAAETWDNLPLKHRRAMIKRAETDIFWKELGERTGKYQKLFLTVGTTATAWYAFRDAISQAFRNFLGG